MRTLDARPIPIMYAVAHTGKDILDRRIHLPRAITLTEQRLNSAGSMVFVEQIARVVIDHNSIGDALEDRVKLFGLRLRVVIEPRVFERDGCLRRQRLEQCLVIFVEASRLLVSQQQPATTWRPSLSVRTSPRE